jgi:hypothetical protein
VLVLACGSNSVPAQWSGVRALRVFLNFGEAEKNFEKCDLELGQLRWYKSEEDVVPAEVQCFWLGWRDLKT